MPSESNVGRVRAIFLAVIMSLSPYAQISFSANAEDSGWQPIQTTESEMFREGIASEYSEGVKSALMRAIDLDRYDSGVLSGTEDWVVITEMPQESHMSSSAGPDESVAAPVLEGAYIWTFEDPARAMAHLGQSLEEGEMEAVIGCSDGMVHRYSLLGGPQGARHSLIRSYCRSPPIYRHPPLPYPYTVSLVSDPGRSPAAS